RNYPNPDRTGCRGPEILREMAEREFPHEHPFWDEHVSHCSPCYREFLDFRNRVLTLESRSRRNATLAVAVAIALIVAAGSIYFFLQKTHETAGRAKAATQKKSSVPHVSQGQRAGEAPAVAAVLNLKSESIPRILPAGTPNLGGEVQRIPRA